MQLVALGDRDETREGRIQPLGRRRDADGERRISRAARAKSMLPIDQAWRASPVETAAAIRSAGEVV